MAASNRRSSRRIITRFFLVCSATVCLWATTASAHHFDRGHFVPAFTPCEADSANTITSSGVDACSPALPRSDCATDPANALRLGEPGKSSFNIRPKGRRRTRANDGQTDIDARIALATVLTCDDQEFQGNLTVAVTMRVQRDDPSCATGSCTLPDITYTHTLPCRSGRCRMVAHANPELEAIGMPPLPVDHTLRMQIITISVLDLAGNPFLSIGIANSEDLGGLVLARVPAKGFRHYLYAWLRRVGPTDANAYGATGIGAPRRLDSRYVRAFAKCDAADTDTTTSDGLAACTGRPLSDCATDPDAVLPLLPDTGNFIDKGKGDIDFSINVNNSSAKLNVHGFVRGLENCGGTPYSGPTGVSVRVRATLTDPACLGGKCTTVSTSLASGSANAANGSIDNGEFISAFGLDLPFGAPGINDVSAEIESVQLLDPSGNPFLIGPAWLVRCNFAAATPNKPGGPAFCFGN